MSDLPKGYEKAPADYSGQVYLESQMRSVRDALNASLRENESLREQLAARVPDVDAICYLATEIRFAKTDEAAQAVIDRIRIMLAAAPQPVAQPEQPAVPSNEKIMAEVGRCGLGFSETRPIGQQWEMVCELVRKFCGQQPAVQGEPVTQPPGLYALQCVISSLTGTSHFSDEEGELTDELRALRDWVFATTRPQPEQPMCTTVDGAAADVAKCLNERKGKDLDLRHVAMLVHHAQQPVAQPEQDHAYALGLARGRAEAAAAAHERALHTLVTEASTAEEMRHAIAVRLADLGKPTAWQDGLCAT